MSNARDTPTPHSMPRSVTFWQYPFLLTVCSIARSFVIPFYTALFAKLSAHEQLPP